MRPSSISATSVESYLGCPMRYAAEAKRINTEWKGPAAFGTALHAALDKYFEKIVDDNGVPTITEHDLVLLGNLWTAAANHYLSWGDDYHQEGLEILIRWVETRPLPNKVLSRELKETFQLVVPGFDGKEQKVTYICDRIDEREDGRIEIVDYKSQYENVNPNKMRRLIQPALYALAMRRKYGAQIVDVTFDMLRFEPVTITFTAREIDEFEEYLAAVTARIWVDENPMETINPNCKWCMRKSVCKTLDRAVDIEYTPTMSTEALALLRDRAKYAKKAFEVLIDEVDTALLAQMRNEDTDTFDTDTHTIGVKYTKRTKYDPSVVFRVLGDDALPFMTVGKTALDKELRRRNGRFSPAQRAEIEDTSQATYSDPQIEATPLGRKDVSA